MQIFKRKGDVTSADTIALRDGQKLRKGQTKGNERLKQNFVIQVLSRVILTVKGCGDYIYCLRYCFGHFISKNAELHKFVLARRNITCPLFIYIGGVVGVTPTMQK